jgi:chromosomal replication initiator protein
MHTIWNEFLTIIREEAGSRVVETWFKAIVFERWDAIEGVVYLVAPNSFVRNWIQKHYLSMMQTHLGRLLHAEKPRIEFVSQQNEKIPKAVPQSNSSNVQVIPASVVPLEKNRSSAQLIKIDSKKIGNLNSNYTFDSFIVGPSNSLAYAAAHAITEQPGTRYNPLFIYGKSGLGKTHLMHAIGNAIKYRYKRASVLYQTADRFVSEFITAIRFNKVHKFQSKYHSIDVLLVDDMQFIANKEHTQEAFFHIFNALYESHKQIVFSSDTFPQDLKGIADRLRSRLACGLVTDIHEPSLETKIAILKKKASLSGELLEDDIAQFIADHSVGNIRELEGALIRVIAFAALTKQSVCIELAQKVLIRTPTNSEKRDVGFDKIMKVIGKEYKYSHSDLCSKQRNKELSEVRHIAMFLMKKLTDKSLRDIGGFLGGRDHSTVMHGLQKIEWQLKTNKELVNHIEKLEAEIQIS